MTPQKNAAQVGTGRQEAGAGLASGLDFITKYPVSQTQPTEIIQCERCKTIETITGGECEKRLDTTGNILCGECYARWLRQGRCRR